MWQSFFQKTLDKFSLQVEKAACLRERYRHHECRLCLQACPAQALSFAEGSLKLDRAKCIECGLCCYLCPTQVFRLEGDPWQKLERVLANKEVACFTCQKQAAFGDVSVPCLEVLSPEVLMPAFLRELPVQIFWQPEQCEECRFSFRQGNLNSWVAQWNSFGGERFYVSLIHHPQEKKSRLKDFSRRDFFAFSQKQIREQVQAFLADSETLGEGSFQEKVALPRKRVYLKTFLDRNPELKGRDLPKPLATMLGLCDIQMIGDCNFCTRCTSLCPTGALQLDYGENSLQLLFEARKCLDCGICTSLCPHLKREYFRTLELWDRVNLLKESKLLPCPRCGEPRAETAEFCPRCLGKKREEQALLDLQEDFWRWQPRP